MASVDLVEIKPGQTVAFEHGGLHVMLMAPVAAMNEGDTVTLTFAFADGATEVVDAKVMRMKYGDHGS